MVYIHECAQTASLLETGRGIAGAEEEKYSCGSSPLEKRRERRGSVEIPRCISRRGSDYIVKTKQEGRLLGGDYQSVEYAFPATSMDVGLWH